MALLNRKDLAIYIFDDIEVTKIRRGVNEKIKSGQGDRIPFLYRLIQDSYDFRPHLEIEEEFQALLLERQIAFTSPCEDSSAISGSGYLSLIANRSGHEVHYDLQGGIDPHVKKYSLILHRNQFPVVRFQIKDPLAKVQPQPYFFLPDQNHLQLLAELVSTAGPIHPRPARSKILRIYE